MKSSIFYTLHLFFFLCAFQLSALTVTWTGSGGDKIWSNPSNWDVGFVPGVSDDVTIPPNAGLVVFNYGTRKAKSLRVEVGSTVRIIAGARLKLVSVVSYGLLNQGTVINRGTFWIRNSLFSGIQNNGLMENYGTILIDQQNDYGLDNPGAFYNYEGASIELGANGGIDIFTTTGVFSNQGVLRFLDGGTGSGILAGALFENTETGEIFFEANHPGNFTASGGQPVNRGKISFYPEAECNFAVYVQAGNSFYNAPTGEIIIKGFDSEGIVVPINSSFINAGYIYIKGTGFFQEEGINVVGNADFTNNASGRIEITNVNNGISLSNFDSRFDNEGSIQCFNSALGVFSNGQFVNLEDGAIEIKNADQAIRNESGATFENAGGSISVSNSVLDDLYNSGTFTNEECGSFIGDNRIYNAAGWITNSGWLVNTAPGSDHVNLGSGIINDGVVLDPYDRFTNILSNNKARVIALDNPQFDVPYPDALDISTTTNLSVSDFYLNANLTQSAGSYDLQTNVYVPNKDAIGATELFAKISIGSGACRALVKIRIDGSILPINTGPVLSFSQQNSTAKIFPNPSTGLVHLQLPKELLGEVTLRLVDSYGRVVYQKVKAATTLSTLDFKHQISTGIYVFQIWQDGQLLHQEKMLVQL